MTRKTSTLLSLGVSAVLIAAAIWFLYSHSNGPWMGAGRWSMGYHSMMGGGMGLVMILFWAVLIGAFFLLITGAANGLRNPSNRANEDLDPLEIIRRRYAGGEITKAQYTEMRQDLER